MHIERKLDLSVYYYIKDLFEHVPAINIVDSFPINGLTLPMISIDYHTIDTYNFEMGTKSQGRLRSWFIDVFAINKAQRDEMAFAILDSLETSIPVYNYDEGFPPSSSPSRIGCLMIHDVKLEILKVIPEFTEKMYYRAVVSFLGEYSEA